MTAKTLMLVGTSSSAGKSLLVTALCHSFARRGIRVAPFKAQNMSNNAAVCPDGAEIGRAQAVQAAAAGLQPTVDMNPILIKPEGNARSQVILMGSPWHTFDARDYYPRKEELWAHVTASLDRLRAEYDLVIIEGAGSPVEMNLKPTDIVNMSVARYAQAPTLLVGDIDRGGIFPQLLGTYWLLDPDEQDLLKGFIVNKFRGDLSLFEDGIDILEERSGVPVLGVMPYLTDLYIPEEDSVALDNLSPVRFHDEAAVDIAVVRIPRISNFDDFDPLVVEPGVRLRYVDSPGQLDGADAVIIPGSKSTVSDLAWMQSRGFAEAIRQHAARGGAVVGICGGYQMLGAMIHDPNEVESPQKHTPGLGLLPIETSFAGEKATHQAQGRITADHGWFAALRGETIEGYEIHMGRTDGAQPWLEITARSGSPVSVPDGATDPAGRVWGSYFHGLFANQTLCHAWLESLGWQSTGEKTTADNRFAASLTYLTDTVEAVLDMALLEKFIWES